MSARRFLKLRFSVYLALLVCACSVIAEEGAYTCEDDSDCPRGWTCFFEGDGRCYSGPEAFPILDTGSQTDSVSSTDSVRGSDDDNSTDDTVVGTEAQTDSSEDSQSAPDTVPSTDTDSGSGSGPECKPEFRQSCGEDGNVHWYDSCGVEGAIFEECASEHGVCVELSQNVAECQCRSGWVGEACDWDICTRDSTNKQSCLTAFGIGRNQMPAQINDTTADYINTLNVECNGRKQPGKDVVFRLYLFAGETLEVSVRPEDKDLSLLLFAESKRAAGEPLCSESTLVACSDNDNAAEESVVYEAQEEGWYFIVVDASVPFLAGAGAYHGETRIVDPKPGICYGD